MDTKCEKCGSDNVHVYPDYFVCFTCKYRKKLKTINAGRKVTSIPKKRTDWKLSGNKGGRKRFFPGLK